MGALLCTAALLAPGVVSAATTTAGTVATNTLVPLYGNITPFYGNITPFYGNITPFYGNITPFYGNITPFWGNITPFWGNITPFTQATDAATVATYGTDYDPFWGSGPLNPYKGNASKVPYASIGAFWTTEAANWKSVQASWSTAATSADGAALAAKFQTLLVNPAVAFWGPAIQAGAPPAPGTSGTRKTAATAQAAFASILGKAGITLNADGTINGNSLLGVSPTQQAVLFLNMYDMLMDYSGTGHVDWWMGKVGWTPALAYTQGKTPAGGTPPTIGMLDFAIAQGAHISKQITQVGSTVFNNGHGAAVGSLIIGSTDGSGVLGVMPQGSANVIVYDPYDASGTTNWTDVGTGIATLSNYIFKGKTTPVGVLNASLGVPGWTLNPGWNDALQTAGAHGHDLVIAAGNDGVTQYQNVPWNFAANPTLLVVGSVGLDGKISNFSNRPGEACLMPSGTLFCSEANKLKYRFIVAPGELILVSDGMGGFTRQSGTSLAAPLVSGAIAMLQNRWPWLANYSDETAQIILKSATPMGLIPGADPTYGVGLLNIAASQAPLNWSRLVYYQSLGGKVSTTPMSFSTVQSTIRSGTQATWNASNLSFTALETIGNTYRDFQIPLSSKLVGQQVTTKAGGQLYQSYLTAALRAQAGRFTASFANGSGGFGFASGGGVPAGTIGGMAFSLGVSPKEYSVGFRGGSAGGRAAYATDGVLSGDTTTFRFGVGEGAVALGGRSAFGFHSDYDPAQGGADPLLGLASGGAYLDAGVKITPRLTISAGGTQRHDLRDLAALGLSSGPDAAAIRHYDAQAARIGLAYAASDRVTLRGSVTALHEKSAALGLQSVDPADLRGGSDTTGITLGLDVAMSDRLALSLSGTAGTTRFGAGQLRTASYGLLSTAGEVALTRTGLFGAGDRLRLSMATPLHVAGGRLNYQSVGVVDRETGALGIVSQSVATGTAKVPLVGEAMYGRGIAHGRGAFSLFGRAEANSTLYAQPLALTGGVQVNFGF